MVNRHASSFSSHDDDRTTVGKQFTRGAPDAGTLGPRR